MQSQQIKPLRIGTRGSPLALYQARLVQRLLGEAHGVAEEDRDEAFPVEVIRTTGDKVQDRALNAIGGKGLFTKEIEEALLGGGVDLAVHSLKDMPTACPEGLGLLASLPREDPRDAFLSPKATTLEALPEGAVIGSTSLRRQAQILAKRPDVKVITYRGNVETRLAKLAAGEVDATLLAVAGLNRLGLEGQITSIFDPEAMVPAVAQGTITVEARLDDARVLAALRPLNHAPTDIAVAAERAFLGVLDGSCRTPIGGHAWWKEGDRLAFKGRILMPDGSGAMDVEGEEGVTDLDGARRFGRRLGEDLKARAGADFMAALAKAVGD